MRKLALSALLTVALGIGSAFAQTALLNVSYDPTRELYKDFNAAWAWALKQPGGSFNQIYLKK